MTERYLSADALASAFPAVLRSDAMTACAAFPATRLLGENRSVRLGDELVTIPGRLHLDPTLIDVDHLNSAQREIADCLLTRHTDGFVRQQHLVRILGLSRAWIPPFVVQLAGEYVVEILDLIYKSLPALDAPVYQDFLCNNPAFLELTGQRITSYWNCYYRDQRQQDYVGFKILEFFRSLRRSPNEQRLDDCV